MGGTNLISHHLFRGQNTELNEIYWVMTARSIAGSLIGIFVPIFLYKIGFSLRDIIIYFLLLEISINLFEIPVAILTGKLGPKFLMSLSMPLFFVFMWMIGSVEKFYWPLWFVALIGGIAVATFWLPYHYDFSKSKKKSESTKEISYIHIILAFAGALCPIIAGFIAGNFGAKYIFYLSGAVSFLGVLPLFIRSNNHVKRELNFKKVSVKEIKNHLISYAASGIEETVVSGICWSLFVFFILGSYQSVGALTTIALTITVGVTYYFGKIGDRANKTKIIKRGSFVVALVQFVKTLASSFLHVFALNLAQNVGRSSYYSIYYSEYYLHADEGSRLEYVTLMEMATDWGKIFGLFVLLVLTYFFSDKGVLVGGLVMGGLASFAIALMPPCKKELKELELKNKKIKVMPRPARG